MSSFTRVIVLSALLFFVGVHSHSYLSSLYIEGQALSEGECLRPIPTSHYDYPIANLDNPNGIYSEAMMCGALPEGKQAAKKKCPVNPGANMGVQWHYQKGAGASDTFIIDPSHKGPCLVYLAKSDTGAGAVWFKIFEDGYNINTKQWCVDKLRANKGRFDFKLPTDIAPGNYLMRVELVALHEGEQLGGAQPYVHCAEITVGGNGNGVPSSDIMVAFPGAYKADSPGILFNIYSGNKYLNINGYPIPGPKLYVSGQGATPVPSTTTAKPATTTAKPVTTTGKPATTTGKPVTTTGKPVTTTGKPATTTAKPVTTTGKPETTGATANSSCVAGADFTACSGTTATQRCYNGVFAPPINCQTGLVCKYSPSSVDKLGNQNGYCMRPSDIPRDNAEANGSSQLVNSLWVSMILFVVCYLL